jgi:hypothetical protein
MVVMEEDGDGGGMAAVAVEAMQRKGGKRITGSL